MNLLDAPRLAGRGLIKEGFAADLVVFDPAKVDDAATFERPHAYATGIPHVIVNGVFVIRAGEHTHAKPGKPLTPEADQSSVRAK